MTNIGYTHSHSFAKLKRVEERMASNATTPQYLKALDNLILKAVTPILLHTSFVEDYVASMLGWQEMNRKRKSSFLDPDAFRLRAVVWLCTSSKEAKLATLPKLSLDRGAFLELCSDFLNTLDPYIKACDLDGMDLDEALKVKHRFESAFPQNARLLSAAREVTFWFEKATDFRTQILEKYIRLCLTKAQSDYTRVFQCRVSLDDLVQTYVMAAGRAIDKCDHTQGVLTNHITNWLLTARAYMLKHNPTHGVSHEDSDCEYTVHSDSASLSALDELENKQTARDLLFVAKLLDPEGYGRAYLGIPDLHDCT